jgi:hypothetical protein
MPPSSASPRAICAPCDACVRSSSGRGYTPLPQDPSTPPAPSPALCRSALPAAPRPGLECGIPRTERCDCESSLPSSDLSMPWRTPLPSPPSFSSSLRRRVDTADPACNSSSHKLTGLAQSIAPPPARSRDAHSSCARAPALGAPELLPPTPAVVGAALAALPVLAGSGVCAACLPPAAEEPVDVRRHVCIGRAGGGTARCASAGRPDARPALSSSPSAASCRESSCAASCEAASSLRFCSSCANAAAWSSTNNPPAPTYPTSPTSPAGKTKNTARYVCRPFRSSCAHDASPVRAEALNPSQSRCGR